VSDKALVVEQSFSRLSKVRTLVPKIPILAITYDVKIKLVTN